MRREAPWAIIGGMRTVGGYSAPSHDREAFAWTASPRPLTGADIRTLMDTALWARFGEATLKAHTQSNGPRTMAPNTRPRPRYSTRTSWAWSRSRRQRIAQRATGSPKPLWERSSGTTWTAPSSRMPSPGSARSLDRGLQHPGATLGARDAEPGRVPGRGYSKLLAVSSPLGSTPLALVGGEAGARVALADHRAVVLARRRPERAP